MKRVKIYTLLGDDSTQTPEDILSPTIRVPVINERGQYVYDKPVGNPARKPTYTVTRHANSDHADFKGWLIKANHIRQRANKPLLQEDVAAVGLFLLEKPEYKTRRGLRWRLKDTLAKTA